MMPGENDNGSYEEAEGSQDSVGDAALDENDQSVGDAVLDETKSGPGDEPFDPLEFVQRDIRRIEEEHAHRIAEEELRKAQDLAEELAEQHDQEAASGRNRIFQAGYVAGAVVGVLALGFVLSSLGSDDSPTGDTAGGEPVLGSSFALVGESSYGERTRNSQFDSYLAVILEFADGQEADEQRPKYVVGSGWVIWPDSPQTDNFGCTYQAERIQHRVDASKFVSTEKAGFVQFDLTTDPVTYEGTLFTRDAHHTVSRSCPDTGSTHTDVYGSSIEWMSTSEVDTAWVAYVQNANGDRLSPIAYGDYFTPGDSGFTNFTYAMVSCEDLPEVCAAIEGEDTNLLEAEIPKWLDTVRADFG